MNTMSLVDYTTLLGPLVGKFATDLVRGWLPKLLVWQTQALAVGLGLASTWVAGYMTGQQLSPQALAAFALATIAINEAGNTLRASRKDEGDSSNPSSDKPVQ